MIWRVCFDGKRKRSRRCIGARNIDEAKACYPQQHLQIGWRDNSQERSELEFQKDGLRVSPELVYSRNENNV